MGVDPDALRRQAQACGLADRISIHETPSDEEIRELISRSGIFVSASAYEGFGLAPIEGASAGLLPVLSDIAPFRNSIRRLGVGMLVDFTKPESWNASYQRLESARMEFTRGIGRDQLAKAVEQFSWGIGAPRFERVYR
jgi:alpha-1,3-mannosyltransferase